MINNIIIPYSLLIAVLIIAAIYDLLFHKIPNWLTYPTILIGIFYYIGIKGVEGFLFSIGGIAVGTATLIIPYLLGGTGAGDVKLLGAVGSLLGPKGVFVAFILTSIVGGIYALILLTCHGYLKEIIKRYGSMLKALVLTKRFIYIPSSHKKEKPKLCYGVAIALGTIISIAFKVRF